MDDVFVNRSLCDLDNVNQRIKELATVKWKDDVVSKPKLRTCINFEDALNPENYAMSIINRQKRALTAQLSLWYPYCVYIESIKYIIHALEIHVCVRDGWVPDWGTTAASSGVIILGCYGNQGEGCYPISHITRFHTRSVKLSKKSKIHKMSLRYEDGDIAYQNRNRPVWKYASRRTYLWVM